MDKHKLDAKRGRGAGRKLSEIAKERRAKSNPNSEWTDRYGGADQHGTGIHKWNHRMRDRDLPPAEQASQGWRWKRADISAMAELERLGLWDKWQPLRKEQGEFVAWEVMLQLLRKHKAEIELKAEKVIAGLNSGGIA